VSKQFHRSSSREFGHIAIGFDFLSALPLSEQRKAHGRPMADDYHHRITPVALRNGALSWAETRVPSGIASLLVATVSLWMVILDWLRPSGVRPAPRVLIGFVLGFAGIALLVGPSHLGGFRTRQSARRRYPHPRLSCLGRWLDLFAPSPVPPLRCWGGSDAVACGRRRFVDRRRGHGRVAPVSIQRKSRFARGSPSFICFRLARRSDFPPTFTSSSTARRPA